MTEHPILSALRAGPRSTRELAGDLAGEHGDPMKVRDAVMRLQGMGLVETDPDRWPDEYVPGNPLVVRLPGDTTRWPGWERWNV